MNLTAKHHEFEDAEILSSHSLGEDGLAKKSILLSNLKIFDHKYLIFSLIPQNEDTNQAIVIPILTTIGLCLAIIALESGIINLIHGHLSGNFFDKYGVVSCIILFCVYTLYFGIAKLFADVRYLIFDGDQVIVHTKKRGAWPMPLKDLKFHIIKGHLPGDRYYLEIELPEETFPDYHRMIIVEVAARRETIEGMLAVLLPLLRGDTGPLERAEKRRYVPIPDGEKPSLWRRYTNWESHGHIWFYNYKINQFLFWLVHGRRKKVMERYI
jgi:hypothetical protein